VGPAITVRKVESAISEIVEAGFLIQAGYQ
jgi:hypothetical protein